VVGGAAAAGLLWKVYISFARCENILMGAARAESAKNPRAALRRLFDCAVRAAAPQACLPGCLAGIAPPAGRTLVLGAGKAAAGMARVAEQCLGERGIRNLSGAVVTRHGHAAACEKITVLEAAHPVPDESCVAATRTILRHAQNFSPNDLALMLISGGGSSLLCAPAAGLTLADKQNIHRALLRAGAPIAEINCVRKHLSTVKGGQLARRCFPARVHTLSISDVPGDDPAVIASGPTVADPTSAADALAVVNRYGIHIPDVAREKLRRGEWETPFPGDFTGRETEYTIAASAATALQAAARAAKEMQIKTQILGDDLQGEARDLGRLHADIIRNIARQKKPGDAPLALLSGGETTVTVTGSGRGGRNAEYLLALTIALAGQPGVYALACDTDGIDGSEDNAGAVTGPDTLARARQLGMCAQQYLDDNDAYGFFARLGGLVVCGPTGTNVNDFRAVGWWG